MYNQPGYGGYSNQGGYPATSYNAYGDNYNKGAYYGNQPVYPNDRYGTYGQGGYNYGGQPYKSGFDECLACLAAMCCCCLMCDMLN